MKNKESLKELIKQCLSEEFNLNKNYFDKEKYTGLGVQQQKEYIRDIIESMFKTIKFQKYSTDKHMYFSEIKDNMRILKKVIIYLNKMGFNSKVIKVNGQIMLKIL